MTPVSAPGFALHPWMAMAFSVAFEVTGTICLKLSDGLTRPGYGGVTVACYLLTFLFFSQALRRIDLGVAYAVWSAAGTATIGIIGILWFKDAATPVRLTSVLLIIAGVIGLNF